MFDPRDIGADTRQPGAVDPRENSRREKMREGHRREYTPSRNRESFERRTARALAEVGMYRGVSFRDLADAHFDGHPYTARRAVDRMVKGGLMREHQAAGPKGGTYKVLTLTRDGATRARRLAHEQGLDGDQQTHAGLVKRGELSHDTAIYRAARIEQAKLTKQGAVLNRVRIDTEMKKQIARAGGEAARARGGKEAADAARFHAAADLALPIKDGQVLYPDAQLEYTDAEGRTGRVNIEVATEHYRIGGIAAKARAGFQMHGNGAQAARLISRALRGDRSGGGRGGGSRDKGTIEL